MKIINKLYFKIFSIKKQLIAKREVQSAFTMLEMLLVFAIFAVLAGIIVFSLQPADVLQDANNIKVLQTTKDIESAIQAYSIAHRGNLTALLGGISEEGYYDICKQDVTDDSCVNLTLLVSEGNLSNIPIDSANAGTYSTGYKLYYKPETKKYDVLTNSEYTSAVASEDPLANGLIGYWKMDEGSWNGTSGEVIDASGNAKNAVAVNGAYISGGKFGNGGTFDGTNDYVNAGDLGTLPAKGTLSFWMKPTAVQNYRNPIATKYNGGNAGFRFEEYTTASPYGGFNVIMGNDAGTYTSHSYLTSTILTVNNWYHVILTWDTLANTVVGYLDGVQKFSEAQTYWPTTIPAMAIGSGFDLTRYWKGNLDEVRIYDRILTSEEATTLYSWGPGPIRHWKFDETSGVIAQDSINLTAGQPIVATGGIVTEIGGYRIHTFTSSGTFTVSSAPANSTVEVLVVGGGGGGGTGGGGGGGGGVAYNSAYAINSGAITVTVGAGGTNTSTWGAAGGQGGNSVFGTITAIGGGAGGHRYTTPTQGSGGSGGGNAGGSSSGTVTMNNGTSGQGFTGGSSIANGTTLEEPGGGGGGAGGAGANSIIPVDTSNAAARSALPGKGGDGLPFSISGTQIYYGGGGGGSNRNGVGAAGGQGGGGAGGVSPVAGTANRGGGGGGTGYSGYGGGGTSAVGGSGVVIVRYPINNNGFLANGSALVSGKYGNAVSLDGVDDFVQVADSSSLNMTGAMTISAWVKSPDPAKYFQMIVSKGSGNAYELRFESTNARSQLGIKIGSTWVDQARYLTSTVLQANTWYHITGVYDGSAVKVYVNGSYDGGYSIAGNISVSNEPLYIGKRADGYNFSGLIDDVRIYNYARSQSQILNDMNNL